MVQKKSKFGYNRGGTFCKQCRYKNTEDIGKIYKFIFGNTHDQTNVAETLVQYLPDGGMQNNTNFELGREMYSLNKRKRWTLPDAIINVIDSGELDDLDIRLVMHERSDVPFRHGWYTADHEIKASTLSYHDSKYTIHHMYPNPKSRVSSLTDLKLNCHLRHNVAESNSRGCETTKQSKKYHTRGVQRMQTSVAEENIYAWRRSEYYFRDVMDGNYHEIREPEVRYEIHYPDIFNKYCRCIKYRGHGMRYPLTAKKCLRHWKTKGCRAKPSMQNYYKGIDHLEKRVLTSDYIREMDEDIVASIRNELNDEIFQKDEDGLVGRQEITLADFCDMIRTPSKQKGSRSSKTKDKTNSCYKTNSYCVNGAPIGQCHGKGNIIYIEANESQNTSESSANDVTVDVSDNEVTGIDMTPLSEMEIDFKSHFCFCVIDKKAIDDAIDNNIEYDIQLGKCVPQQLCMTIKGGLSIGRALLLQRSGWFSCSDQAEYWIKVQFESDGTVAEMSSENLQSKLDDEKEAILSLDQIAAIVKQESANRMSVTKRQRDKDNVLPSGYLTAAITDPSFDVKTVHEAYESLREEYSRSQEDDILESFELVNMPISSGLDICEICFCETNDPQVDGYTLLPCQHYFCIDCWRQHITIRIKEGATNIPCQAFKCKEFVDDVMVYTVVSCDLINLWLQRKKEQLLESQSWHWCPTVSCKKVATVTTASSRFFGDNVPVLCDCDRVWCFSCQSGVHWPATCEQHLNYRKTLSQNGHTESGSNPGESRLYYVDVKRCPMCKHPIEKNGGCPQMVCRCSHAFCWECLRDRSSHIDGVECRANSTRLITMTLDDTEYSKMQTRMYRKCVEHRFKWKKTFSNRDIEQRVKQFACSTAYKFLRKTTKFSSLSTELIDHSANEELRSSLIFIREVHLVLENIYVMLSYASRRLHRNWGFLDHVEFCLYRIEQILNKSRLDQGDLRRVSRLCTSIEGSLRILPHLTTVIQKELQIVKGRDQKKMPSDGRNST